MNHTDARTIKPEGPHALKALALEQVANVREEQRANTERYRQEEESKRAIVFANWARYFGLDAPEGAHRYSGAGILFEVEEGQHAGTYPFSVKMPCPACGEMRVRLYFTAPPVFTDYAFKEVLRKLGEQIEDQTQREAAYIEWSKLSHGPETFPGCDCKFQD